MNAKLNNQSKHKENRLFCTRFIRFLIALAAMTVSTTSAWGQTKSIKYLKYVGGATAFEEATANATQITSSSEYLGGNYYVEGDVTFSSTVILRDDTQIILCDGTTLTINATDGYGIILDTYRLTIYAQSSGRHAGKLIINCNNDGISGSSNVTINGGIISVTSASYEAIVCGNFTVNGGAVTAVGNGSSYNGISSRDFTINGGKVSATGKMDGIIGSSLATHGVTINGGQVYAKGDDDGIYSEVGINLGWTNAEDYIESNSYTTLSPINIIKDFYINGSTTLSAGTIAGTTSSFTIDDSSIAGKRLTPNTTDPIYTISLGTGITGGTVEVDKTKAFVGERVAINVTPPDGYYLASLTCKYGSTSVDITQQANDNVFTMPASDVTVNATFNPYVAQIGDTKYPTLQAAFNAVPNGGATTIDILREITEATTARGNWDNPNITLNLNGKDVTIGGMTSLASLSIYGNGGKMTVKNNLGISNSNGDNADQLLIDKATIIIEDGIQWMAEKIKLQNNAKVTIYNNFVLGYSTEELSVNIDNGSWMKLISCAIGATNGDQAKAALLPLVCPDLREAFTVPGTYGTASEPYYLRGSWGIELKNGLSNATTTFYEAPSTFDPDAEFAPSAYTTSTTYIDNSDGLDHYVIAHIVPDPFYWTDLSLLTHQESKSSGADTPAGLTLLKADQYNVNALDPSLTPDWRDRLDGAGWYYYILPGTKTVANGYTTSTIGGEAVQKFNFDTQTVSQDFDNKTVTVSRPSDDTWTATLTYDKFEWKFGGSFTLADMPKVQSISVKKDGIEKFTISGDKIATQVTNGYDLNQARIGNNNLLIPQDASGYGWFSLYDYSISKYKVLVPFDGDGSSGNPWQIKTAADLSLLAKCVNVGGYPFNGETLAMVDDKTYDMSGSDFEPIGTDSNLPFRGTLHGNGSTIKNISFVFSGPSAVSDETQYGIGLIGNLGDNGEPNLSGNVDNIRLENCSFSSSANDICYVGSIAGAANRGSVSNCYIIGGNVSAAMTGSHAGAIVGKLGGASLSNNYYDYTTIATLGSSTASGYTKRGICTETISVEPGSPSTYDWKDFPTSEGAVLWVKKATINETKPTGSTSSVAFSQKTPGDNCYALDGNDVLYAVGQPITLTVTEGQSKADGIRTFYDGLSSLTVNGSSDGVDLANRSFSMPEADAEIAATFTPSNWFTIPSNGKKWMSFYHEWKDANNAPENYTVSDYNTAGAATPKTIEVKTITAADSKTGEVTFGSLEGVSYSGMPTLFHCETVLPDVLKFTPNTTATTTVTPATQFIGVDTATPATQLGDGIYVMNGDGDFIWASDTSEKLGAHKCYVNLGKAAGRRLTVISDDNATGIHSIDNGPSTMDDADGAWYSIDGRKLQVKPTKKGLYIYKGKKTVIK